MGTLLIVGIGAWVVTLPMRQTRFQVLEHRLERTGQGAEVRGRLRNRGAEARQVLVEAYLYDGDNRWLGTARTSLEVVPADSAVAFAVAIEARLAGPLERYSLYAGLEPNPLAPGM
ncbi:MAG TPA: FxLYD domain-containing protein [Gemmatimonadota bacterium]|nr:FxLYD domain-containing protein [Gemmatimonadota bacterium]